MGSKSGPKIYINKAFVYGKEGPPKTKKSKRYIDCLPFVIDVIEAQRQLTGNEKYMFLTKDGDRMNPDHLRNVVWKPALEKAGLEYRPPIQTRHTFAMLMVSLGEDLGWIQNMLGHSSLQMIYTRYHAWRPKETRKDGSAIMKWVAEKQQAEKDDENVSATVSRDHRKADVIPFPKNGTKTAQST
ncbi:MAG: tyrosine-type recombinase/integrase [Thermodesulfobacteriota bacterium]